MQIYYLYSQDKHKVGVNPFSVETTLTSYKDCKPIIDTRLVQYNGPDPAIFLVKMDHRESLVIELKQH